MFSKKCRRCDKKVSKQDNFCPNCGNFLGGRKYLQEKNKKDYGLLGKDDNLFEEAVSGSFGFGGLFNIGKLIKEFDRQFKELDKGLAESRKLAMNNKKGKKTYSSGISISISTSGNGEPKISIKKFGDANKKEPTRKARERPLIKSKLTDDEAKKISKLPKEEAKTNVRRLSKKIVYEIALPGVRSLDNVIIQRLENSIEIKAFSDKKAYFKLLPINLPIADYKLLKSGKLIIELLDEE